LTDVFRELNNDLPENLQVKGCPVVVFTI